MELKTYLPSSAEDYITCFRTLAALVDSALHKVESINEWESETEKNKSFATIAASIETIASLRGDSGLFFDARPQGLNTYQNEMYATEDHLRARLLNVGYTKI